MRTTDLGRQEVDTGKGYSNMRDPVGTHSGEPPGARGRAANMPETSVSAHQDLLCHSYPGLNSPGAGTTIDDGPIFCPQGFGSIVLGKWEPGVVSISAWKRSQRKYALSHG